MALRVTPGMMHLQLSRNLNRNLMQMSSLQEQMATGRKINKASDDPVGITYALRYRAELSSNSQYQENADSAHSWLDFNDTVLGQAGDVMQRIKELTVNGSNGTNPQTALDAINNELTQLKSQLLDIANSKLNGKYIFSGQTFDKMPYNENDPNFDAKKVVTDTGDISYAVGVGVVLPVNLSGNEVFGGGDPVEADNVFAVIDNIISKFTLGDQAGAAAELTHVDSRLNKILNARSEVGAKVNRVELMQNRLDDLEINLTDMQSKTEDADYDKLLIDAKINENIYQASLSVGAKVITPTLVDFLR
ncbi:flagellar hook-associated protein FlgL [Paenibacillus lycopersici]|uniref:Flagellar hook-associated protein FlgL n=1 Tax=Paenibacillus lycopersici TaxID=2704462 RepID=A0A6C0G6N7_9BACL|nr:flagellar hook-associated protein FlgL [Paenibacillus lycopersici]QHT63450.1 flagellar hook-associated protein FlgL [Paenibacillus lycopersici]